MVLLSTGSISFIQLIYVFHTFWLILPTQSHHNRLCHTYVYTMAFWSFSRTFSRIFLVLSSPKKFWLFWQCLFWLLLKCFNWSRYIFKYEPVVVSNVESVGSSDVLSVVWSVVDVSSFSVVVSEDPSVILIVVCAKTLQSSFVKFLFQA